MKIDWLKILKVSGGVATLALGWLGGANQDAIIGQVRGTSEPSYYERRSMAQLDENLRDNKEYTVRVEQRFEKKFEIIDGKLDRIIELQLRPRIEKDAEVRREKQFHGG